MQNNREVQIFPSFYWGSVLHFDNREFKAKISHRNVKIKFFNYLFKSFRKFRDSIQEDEPLFAEYKASWKAEDEFILQKDNIIFPIKDFKDIRFFFVLKKPEFDVYWFKSKVRL